jgi:hypothetical protein
MQQLLFKLRSQLVGSGVQPGSNAKCWVLQAYKAALADLQTGDFDSMAPRAYSSLYAELAATNAGKQSCLRSHRQYFLAGGWHLCLHHERHLCSACSSAQPDGGVRLQL